MANEVLKIALGALAFALPAAVLAQAAPAAPNLAQCGRYQPQEGDMELERKGPLPVCLLRCARSWPPAATTWR